MFDDKTYARIIGNTLMAFAITAISINITGEPSAMIAAFYVAFITAVIAFAKEMQNEGKDECEPPSKLGNLLVF